MSADDKKPYSGGWYEGRNEDRRERYHTDPAYRATANKLARDGYRSTRGTQKPFDPRVNLPTLESFGVMRLLHHGDAEALTFSKAELATIFSRPTKQIQQWAADGRIPAPKERAKIAGVERNWIDVYYLDEARAMVEALGPFLAEFIYFRCDHVDAIKAVHDAIEKVRG